MEERSLRIAQFDRPVASAVGGDRIARVRPVASTGIRGDAKVDASHHTPVHGPAMLDGCITRRPYSRVEEKDAGCRGARRRRARPTRCGQRTTQLRIHDRQVSYCRRLGSSRRRFGLADRRHRDLRRRRLRRFSDRWRRRLRGGRWQCRLFPRWYRVSRSCRGFIARYGWRGWRRLAEFEPPRSERECQRNSNHDRRCRAIRCGRYGIRCALRRRRLTCCLPGGAVACGPYRQLRHHLLGRRRRDRRRIRYHELRRGLPGSWRRHRCKLGLRPRCGCFGRERFELRYFLLQLERLAGGLAEVSEILSARLDQRVLGRECGRRDAIRSAITRLGVRGLTDVFRDDAEVVQRVREVGMSGAELPLLEGSCLTQVLLR